MDYYDVPLWGESVQAMSSVSAHRLRCRTAHTSCETVSPYPLDRNKYSPAKIGSFSLGQHDEDDSASYVPRHTLFRYDKNSIIRRFLTDFVSGEIPVRLSGILGTCVEVSADIVCVITSFWTQFIYILAVVNIHSSPSTWQKLAMLMVMLQIYFYLLYTRLCFQLKPNRKGAS